MLATSLINTSPGKCILKATKRSSSPGTKERRFSLFGVNPTWTPLENLTFPPSSVKEHHQQRKQWQRLSVSCRDRVVEAVSLIFLFLHPSTGADEGPGAPMVEGFSTATVFKLPLFIPRVLAWKVAKTPSNWRASLVMIPASINKVWVHFQPIEVENNANVSWITISE